MNLAGHTLSKAFAGGLQALQQGQSCAEGCRAAALQVSCHALCQPDMQISNMFSTILAGP